MTDFPRFMTRQCLRLSGALFLMVLLGIQAVWLNAQATQNDSLKQPSLFLRAANHQEIINLARVALKPPAVPYNSQLLQSFHDDNSGGGKPFLREKWTHWHPNAVRRASQGTRSRYPAFGSEDPRGFGPSVNPAAKTDPNGPNGPGMPGGSPMY
jgi:hypothetical protein